MVIPEKAQVLRVLICELNRIASHLVGMGAYGLDLGSFSPFLYPSASASRFWICLKNVCARAADVQLPDYRWRSRRPARRWLDRCKRFLEYFKPRIPDTTRCSPRTTSS